jgi:hypothetical protein
LLTSVQENLHELCSTDIELRAFSRGFLSADRGFSTSFSPVRRHADTIAFCGCGYAALWSSVKKLFGVRLRFFAFTTATIWQGYGPDHPRSFFGSKMFGRTSINSNCVALVAQQ